MSVQRTYLQKNSSLYNLPSVEYFTQPDIVQQAMTDYKNALQLWQQCTTDTSGCTMTWDTDVQPYYNTLQNTITMAMNKLQTNTNNSVATTQANYQSLQQLRSEIDANLATLNTQFTKQTTISNVYAGAVNSDMYKTALWTILGTTVVVFGFLTLK